MQTPCSNTTGVVVSATDVVEDHQVALKVSCEGGKDEGFDTSFGGVAGGS